MPNMNAIYRNNLANHGAGLINYIGLVDNTGAELSGGDPAYARKAVTWATADDGYIEPDDNITFDIPADTNVSGWRGYEQLNGGTEYGGKSLEREDYLGQGTYTLLANNTGIRHD